jgi:2-iminobutanoate/2-iminopropanoate deaminase
MAPLTYHNDLPGAPRAVGPYSQAVEINGIIFLSGQVGIDPTSGTLVAGGFETEVKQVIANIKSVLTGVGLSLSHVVKATVFVTDLGQFAQLNEIYGAEFGSAKPARTTIQVSKLPLGASVEIEVLASR